MTDIPNNEQVCPHCKKKVDPLRAPAVSVVEGRITHFCSADCRELYLERLIAPLAVAEKPEPQTTALKAEPSEDEVLPSSDGDKTIRTKASGSPLLRNQLFEFAATAAIFSVSLFMPGLLGETLLVAVTGVGIFAVLLYAVIRDRHLGPARMAEAAAVPFASAAVLACTGLGLAASVASIASASILMLRSLGLLLEILGRKNSGILDAIEGAGRFAKSSSWKDNSRKAERIRRVALTLEWARYPAAVSVGFLVYFLHSKSLYEALISGATALMALGPRALRMSTGDAHLAAALTAARGGVLIRDAHVVDRLASARIALFMTNRALVGREINVVDWLLSEGADEKTALGALSSLEASAEGRIASAILDFTGARHVSPAPVENKNQVSGLGVLGDTNWGPAICGSRSLLLENGVSTALIEDQAAIIENSGRRAVFLSLNGETIAIFGIEETPVSGVQHVTQQLKSMGLEPQMTTSAEVDAAQALGRRVGIESVRFLTSEKDLGTVLSNISASGDNVILVGRGPAFEENLISAAAAIAVGQNTPTQAGVDAGSKDVGIVPWIVNIAKRADLSVKINLVVAIAAVTVGMSLSTGWHSPFVVVFAASLCFIASALTTLNGPYPLVESIFGQLRNNAKKLKRAAVRRWSTDK